MTDSTIPEKDKSPIKQSPLLTISLFISIATACATYAAVQTSGVIQYYFLGFFVIYTAIITVFFMITLWCKNWVFYTPESYNNSNPEEYVKAMQGRFGNLVTKTSDLKGEIKVVGNPDLFKLLFKAQGKSWKKSTKVLEVPTGCIVQVTTEVINPDRSCCVAEALVFVPNIKFDDFSVIK